MSRPLRSSGVEQCASMDSSPGVQARRHPNQPAHHDRYVVESGLDLVLLVIGVLCATLMQTLDTTIVNVALPTIQGNLGASQDEGAWVFTGYIISAVIVIPLTPWLQLRFGRRQYYATAVIGFTIASIFCGFATNITELIVWRIIQGLFGGGLIATAQATLRDTFPPEKLGASQAIFALGAIVGPSIGPTIGGWLTDNFSWNYVFFINIVPGTFAATILLLRLKNPTDPKRIPVDGIGLGLLALGLGALQYILDEGQRHDWFSDPLLVCLALVAASGLSAFIAWELWGTNNPIVDLRVLRHRAAAAGAALGFMMGAVLFGATIILPQYVQGLLGFTATLSGELIFVRAFFIALGTPIMARLVGSGRIDARILIALGFVGVGISQWWLGLVTTTGNTLGSLLPPLILGGIAISCIFTPLSISVLRALPQALAPKAAAFQSLSLQLGGSFSTAGLITLLARRSALHLSRLAGAINPTRLPVQTALQHHASVGQLAALVEKQATVLAYADCQYVLGALTFLLLPCVLVLPRYQQNAGPIEISAE